MKNTENQESNVASINNHYTKEQIQQVQKAQKQLVFRRRRLAVIFAGSAIIFLLVGLNLMRSNQELIARKNEKAEVLSEQQAIKEKQVALKSEVKLLKDDEYVTKLARSKYLYSKEGEQVYKLPSKQNQEEQESDSSTTKDTQSGLKEDSTSSKEK